MCEQRKTLLDLLALLRSQRGVLWDRDKVNGFVLPCLRERIRDEMRKGKRIAVAANTVASRPIVVTPDENTVLRIIAYVETTMKDKRYGGSQFLDGLGANYVLAQCIPTQKGRLYVVRKTHKPDMIVFTAHFFDRWQQRLETDAQRLDLLTRMLAHWQEGDRKRDDSIFCPIYDAKTLEQFIVIPEGICLGYAIGLPLQDDLLFLDDRARKEKNRTALVQINTLITDDMLTSQQIERIKNLYAEAQGITCET